MLLLTPPQLPVDLGVFRSMKQARRLTDERAEALKAADPPLEAETKWRPTP